MFQPRDYVSLVLIDEGGLVDPSAKALVLFRSYARKF